MTYCAHCQKSYESGGFCPVCGQPTVPAQPEQYDYPAQTDQYDYPAQTDQYDYPAGAEPAADVYDDGFAKQAANPQPEPPRKKGSKAPLIILIIVLALAVAAAGYAVYYVMTHRDTPQDRAGASSAQETAAESAEATEEPTETAAIPAPTEAPAETTAPTEAPAETVPSVPERATVFSGADATNVLKSQTDSQGVNHTYGPLNVLVNGNNACWSTDGSGVGESITLGLPGIRRVQGLEIVNGYAGSESQYEENAKPVLIRCSFSDGTSETLMLTAKPTEFRYESQYLVFENYHDTSYVEIEILAIEEGSKYSDTCISYIAPY